VVQDGRIIRSAEFVTGEIDVTVVFLYPFRFGFGFAVFFIAFYSSLESQVELTED
jgi:hypothetical protein